MGMDFGNGFFLDCFKLLTVGKLTAKYKEKSCEEKVPSLRDIRWSAEEQQSPQDAGSCVE